MSTLEEKIAIMQAFAEGREVFTRRVAGNGCWTSTPAPCWDWTTYEYQVIPKPIEFWVWSFTAGGVGSGPYDSEEAVRKSFKPHTGRAVLMREVSA